MHRTGNSRASNRFDVEAQCKLTIAARYRQGCSSARSRHESRRSLMVRPVSTIPTVRQASTAQSTHHHRPERPSAWNKTSMVFLAMYRIPARTQRASASPDSLAARQGARRSATPPMRALGSRGSHRSSLRPLGTTCVTCAQPAPQQNQRRRVSSRGYGVHAVRHPTRGVGVTTLWQVRTTASPRQDSFPGLQT